MLAFHLPTYRPLTRCGPEELAVHTFTHKPSGGMLFARKPADAQKRAAREAILALLTPERVPEPISVLTMPGLKWKFEGALMRNREGGGELKAMPGPTNTTIHCIENDRALYHCSMLRMPGLRNPEHVFRVHSPTKFAERVTSGLWIDRFFFGNVDDLMKEPPQDYDVVWLDYTGPLSIDRLRVIRRFWAKNVRKAMIVTSLKARWNRETSDAIERAGCLSAWLRHHIEGTVLHDLEYDDGSPMEQIAFTKEA